MERPFFEDPTRVRVGDSDIAVRRFGEGPAIVFVHGWPLSGATWRRVVERLPGFSCIVPDLPGFGDTRSPDKADLSLPAQARALTGLLDTLEIDECAAVGQDSGGAIARLWASRDARVKQLTLVNTELPGHHPPGIDGFIVGAKLPGAALLFRSLLRSRRFRQSRFGFQGCFWDMSLMDDEFEALFVTPLIESPSRLRGALRYAAAIDWSVIDAFDRLHRELTIPVRFVWGENDPWFPLHELERVLPQFKHLDGVRRVPRAKLLVHEEHPKIVAEEVARGCSTEPQREDSADRQKALTN